MVMRALCKRKDRWHSTASYNEAQSLETAYSGGGSGGTGGHGAPARARPMGNIVRTGGDYTIAHAVIEEIKPRTSTRTSRTGLHIADSEKEDKLLCVGLGSSGLGAVSTRTRKLIGLET